MRLMSITLLLQRILFLSKGLAYVYNSDILSQLRLARQLRRSSDQGTTSFAEYKRFKPYQLNNAIELQSKKDLNELTIEDGDNLQSLFSEYCDDEGLLSKADLIKIPFMSELLEDEDLLQEELDEIWKSAPKFPIVKDDVSEIERIDVDSFIQIYRDIDDLFEDDVEEIISETVVTDEKEPPNKGETQEKNNSEIQIETDGVEDKNGDDPILENEEVELTQSFQALTSSKALLSRSGLRSWEEIETLIVNNMLSEEEFDLLWERTSKSPGESDMIDIEGFLSFNVALDDLFVFEEEDGIGDDRVDDQDAKTDPNVCQEKDIELSMAETGPTSDIPPNVLFYQIANEDSLVGKIELRNWFELQELLKEGDLLPSELDQLFENALKATGTNEYLNENGFVFLYYSIDELFEDEEDEDSINEVIAVSQSSGFEEPKNIENTISTSSSTPSMKSKLLDFLYKMNEVSKEFDDEKEEQLPCGLDLPDTERKKLDDFIFQLEQEKSNKVISEDIIPDDLAGTWNLLYTSSPMMKYNKGLSGLGGSFPNGKFFGLKQILRSSSFLMDVEYIERINVSTPPDASFDVKVTGDWELKKSISLLTGAPSVVLSIEPNKVMYGPTSTRADHWKSVRSMNLLDVVYLDSDLRIMRGNMNSEVLFVFQRV